MDQFGNILTNATNQANQTYNTDTTNAANAQTAANAASNNVNSEAQLANQNAAHLSALGDTYSNQATNVNNFNQAEQHQLNTVGFDKNTLNAANQNIAQETGQLGAAQNQMNSEGGTRGFNAVGAENRLTNVQNQASNAINANAKVQSNELGQANAASTLTGQDMNYQLGQNTNAINAYNDAATQNNNVMANYANQLNTLAQQATTYGGLVGSNIVNIMSAANSAAQAHLAKYQAETQVTTQNLQRAQAGLASAQAGLASAQTTGQNIQNTYNTQLDSWKQKAQKQVTTNNANITTQINALSRSINNEQKQISSNSSSANTGSGWAHLVLDVINPDNIIGNMDPFSGPQGTPALKAEIASQQANIQQLNSQKSTNVM